MPLIIGLVARPPGQYRERTVLLLAHRALRRRCARRSRQSVIGRPPEFRMGHQVGLSFRKSKKVGPFRIGISESGLSGGVGGRRARIGGSTSGCRSVSVNLGRGLRCFKSFRRRR